MVDYYRRLNPDIVKKIREIDSEITEEMEKESADKEKISKLRQKQLMIGLMLPFYGYQNDTNKKIY